MIACLKGELFHKAPEKVIVDVNGIGYEVFLSMASHDRLPAVGDEVFLHTYTHVREEALNLFGFIEVEEKEMFLLLINVSGVGPKLALSILSGIRPAELAKAISMKDLKRLTGLSGVGKKTAERLCLDLKDKIGLVHGDDEVFDIMTSVNKAAGSVTDDVISALVNLGYPQVRAFQAISAVKKRLSADEFLNLRVEDMLRETLRSLA